MRRAAVRELQPGMMLARAVYSERGDLLLNADVQLSERYINLLRDRGFFTVFVHDADTVDVEIEDIISERVRVTVTSDLCRVYEAMERATAPMRDQPTGAIEQEMQSADFARVINEHAGYHALQEDIEQIVEEVLAADVMTGMNTLRTFDSYQFIHALDSTATALMLGRRMHYDHADLMRLASGCLLHDIGMVMVDRAIQNKPSRLNSEELERIRRHPALGYEMLRKMRPQEVLANHIAFQHHERQDGTGYPRGLHGNNRIFRAPADRAASGRIVLDAEIVAIADVYDALGSDRPYRPAMPPDQVVKMLRRIAGSHVNREIVNQLLAVLPIYPLGTDVVVMSGRYARHRGIISRVHKDELDRPTVRLLFDPERHRMEPVEIDLRQTEDVITCIATTGPDTPSAPAGARPAV